MTTTHVHDHHFPTATDGLPVWAPTTIVEVGDGDTYDQHIARSSTTSATPNCGCSPTTAPSPARRSG